MDNSKKNKSKNRQNPDTNTEVLNTKEEKTDDASEVKKENDDSGKAVRKGAKEKAETQKNNDATATRQESGSGQDQKNAADRASGHIRGITLNSARILLPVAACAIVIAVAISFAVSRKSQTVELNLEEDLNTSTITWTNEPLAENAVSNVNDLMRSFYTALADGDMDTVRAIKDYNTDREIITYEKKSEFIESYENINCYTKPGMDANSYFVYTTYDVKFKDIASEAPGLNAFYIYTADDGSLRIDGDTEESVKAAFKLVTSQDDVVDLYNKINVNYKEALAADETLEQFMEELPSVVKESVGVALAQLEVQGENAGAAQTESGESGDTQPPAESEASSESEVLTQNQVVNQIVKTTDTVNVRSSDSEEADKIGKAQAGIELTRIEERVNGWSKVIFEGKEAFIKSDYLEVVASEEVVAPSEPNANADANTGTGLGTVTATTNVNVRNRASQDADKIGTAQAGVAYTLLEDQGEWYKIEYRGTIGFVKSEFFQR